MGRGARTIGRTGAAAGTVAALMALSAAPGAAAAPVAQASASAVTVSVAGRTAGAGSFSAVNDGDQQSTSGSRTPQVSVLGGQSLISAGTLAQDATTSVEDDGGRSAACAGLAGPGATVASVGDSGGCLTPGQTLTLNSGSLDLGRLQLIEGPLLQGLDTQVATALQPVLATLLPALQSGLDTALDQLGLGLDVGLGAVQSSCTAGPNGTDGSAHLVGAGASVTVGGQQIDLLDLPADPPPNTHVVTNLSAVADTIEKALTAQFTTLLSTQLPGPLATALGPLQALLQQAGVTPAAVQSTVLNNGLAQIGAALEPLQDNVIDATLNQQSHAAPDQITVTALDLELLPAAAQALGATAFELQVGTSSCGPGGRVAEASPQAEPATPTAAPTPAPRHRPTAVPTAVPAGLASVPRAQGDAGRSWGGLLAVGGLLVVAVAGTGAVWTSVRRP